MDQTQISAQIHQALAELSEAARLEKGAWIVTGCSTSEIAGGRIGKASVPEIGEWVARAVIDFCEEHGFVPLFQCCEHLNRALVMPLQAAKERDLIRVSAVPQPKAGGSVPAAAWRMLREPCLVLQARADAGIDIGDTLIGMHIRPVAVPFRGEVRQIGYANLVCAFSRLPYIGGERAVYR
ncbi:MAG: TIGR01440 family protein [Clostridia bacterium]|nr:TIGR01440 family protein [Clostridia bacterium]